MPSGKLLLAGPHIQHTDHALIVVEQWQLVVSNILFEDGRLSPPASFIEGGGPGSLLQHVAGASQFRRNNCQISRWRPSILTCDNRLLFGVGCSAHGLGRAGSGKVRRRWTAPRLLHAAGGSANVPHRPASSENHRAPPEPESHAPTNGMSWCHDAGGFPIAAEQKVQAAGLAPGWSTSWLRGLLRIRLSPDAVTVIGTVEVSGAAACFFPDGEFVIGILIMVLFVFSRTCSTLARWPGVVNQRTGVWGAFLDSTRWTGWPTESSSGPCSSGLCAGSRHGCRRGIRLPGRGS